MLPAMLIAHCASKLVRVPVSTANPAAQAIYLAALCDLSAILPSDSEFVTKLSRICDEIESNL